MTRDIAIQLGAIFMTAIIGAICIPVMACILARFGFFEPLSFKLFGRTWTFAPRNKRNGGA